MTKCVTEWSRFCWRLVIDSQPNGVSDGLETIIERQPNGQSFETLGMKLLLLILHLPKSHPQRSTKGSKTKQPLHSNSSAKSLQSVGSVHSNKAILHEVM